LKPSYWESKDTYLKPGLQFYWTTTTPPVRIDVEWTGDGFLLFIDDDEHKKHDDLSSCLIEKMGLVKTESRLEKKVATESIVDEVASLRETLKSLAGG
jgi:hypothetical protein